MFFLTCATNFMKVEVCMSERAHARCVCALRACVCARACKQAHARVCVCVYVCDVCVFVCVNPGLTHMLVYSPKRLCKRILRWKPVNNTIVKKYIF